MNWDHVCGCRARESAVDGLSWPTRAGGLSAEVHCNLILSFFALLQILPMLCHACTSCDSHAESSNMSSNTSLPFRQAEIVLSTTEHKYIIVGNFFFRDELIQYHIYFTVSLFCYRIGQNHFDLEVPETKTSKAVTYPPLSPKPFCNTTFSYIFTGVNQQL